MFILKTNTHGCYMYYKNRQFAKSTTCIDKEDLEAATRGFTSHDLTWPSRCGAIIKRLESKGYNMQTNFRAVSQVYLDIAIWPLWQKFERNRKFWALRVLVDDVIPPQVLNYLQARSMQVQIPIFDN